MFHCTGSFKKADSYTSIIAFRLASGPLAGVAAAVSWQRERAALAVANNVTLLDPNFMLGPDARTDRWSRMLDHATRQGWPSSVLEAEAAHRDSPAVWDLPTGTKLPASAWPVHVDLHGASRLHGIPLAAAAIDLAPAAALVADAGADSGIMCRYERVATDGGGAGFALQGCPTSHTAWT